MRVLLVTRSAVLRQSVSQALVDRGHEVRVLTRPDDAPTRWPAGVEPWEAQSDDAEAMTPAAGGCDVAIIIDDRVGRIGRPDRDPEAFGAVSLNTLNRLGLRCISVAARSEHRAEPGREDEPWLRIWCDPVYGTGEDMISLFLIMMRTLPAVPVLSATRTLRPLWHEDLARAVAGAVSAGEPSGSVDLAAPESTTYDRLFESVAALIDRRPLRLPVPSFIAEHGAALAELLHLAVPFDASVLGADDQPASRGDALTSLGVAPTPLDVGLRRLANEMPEVVPSEGLGRIDVKRFTAEITGSPHSAPALLRLVRSRFGQVMPTPVGVEPVSPQTRLEPDAVLTIGLPIRGHVQIRVAEVTADHVVGVTLRGHALAGCVEFYASPTPAGVQFGVMTCENAATPLDWLTLSIGGARLQDANWHRLVQNVIELSGGRAAGVVSDGRRLTPEETETIARWIRDLVEGRGGGMPAALAFSAAP